MRELDFYSSEELINELIQRTTFAGIIIRSKKEVKTTCEKHKSWCMSTNINPVMAHNLLDEITQQFRNRLSY